MIFRAAMARDVATYVAFAVTAQAWLRERGLEQYVPAAHPAASETIATRVAAGSLIVVESDGKPAGFFSLEETPSQWWSPDQVQALYLAGMVVGSRFRGQAVGSAIIAWCIDQARSRGCRAVRLDCHAGNPWLCRYYEGHGFVLQGRLEQHPGYLGCLYERLI